MRYALCDFSLSGGSEGDRKPSSVSLPFGRDEDHFSRALIAQGLKRPHPPRLSPKDGEIRMGCSHPRVLRESRAYLVLLQVGFTRLPRSLEVPVGSYPAFSTLPCGIGEVPFHRAVSFLWHFPYPVKQTLPPLHRAVRVTDHPALWSSDFPLPRLPGSREVVGSGPLFPLVSSFLLGFDHRLLDRLIGQVVRLPVQFPRDRFNVKG
jgi:hypothetical protein